MVALCEFKYRLIQRAELLKSLRGIDRVRTRSEKSHRSELNRLKNNNYEQYETKIYEYENYDSLEQLNRLKWIEQLETNNDLIKIYDNDVYLRSRYSTIELSHIVESAAVKTSYVYNDDFILEFEEAVSFSRGYLSRKGIVPVSFLSEIQFFANAKDKKVFPESIDFSESFRLVTSVKAESCFKNMGISDQDIDVDSFKHCERMTKNALTKSPLLVFKVEASGDREQDRIKDKFLWFRMIVDYFILYNDLKSSGFSDGSHPKVQHFFSLRDNEIQRYTMNFESSFDIDFMPQNFEIVLDDELFSYVLDIYEKDQCFVRNKIYNSFHFFSKAHRENDSIDKFLSYIISIESLCCMDNQNIGRSLCNFIVGESYKGYENERLVREMKDVYSLRSKIVHHGATFVSAYAIRMAEVLALVSIRKALRLYKELTSQTNLVTKIEWAEKIKRQNQ